MAFKKNIRYDGMAPLFSLFSREDFIKLAIQSSYFFDSVLVKERHQEVLDAIKQHKALPARKTTRKEEKNPYQFKDETGLFINPIEPDAFGNDKVIKLINSRTGYAIARVNSNFPNYVISHIWGNAKDPRYFTNFWNIVLIPAWANHLMDKKDNTGNVGTKLKNTIMAVCYQVYHMHQLDWKGMSMAGPPQYQEALVQKETYSVHVIEGIKGQQKVGDITEETITI